MNYSAVEWLLRDVTRDEAMDIACQKRNWRVLQMLSAAGVEISRFPVIASWPRMFAYRPCPAGATDSGKRSPLHFAVHGNIGIVHSILNGGANPNARDSHGATPLHQAKDAETVNVLVSAGAEVDAVNEDKQTPLMRADKLEVVQALLSLGAEATRVDMYGGTVLHHAAALKGRDGPGICQALLDAGADPNALNSVAANPLFYAGNGQIARVLVQAGADLTCVRRSDGTSPLGWAALQNAEEIAVALLSCGADVNFADPTHGRTALYHAIAGQGSVSLIQILLNAGADFIVNGNGESASEVAREKRRSDCVEFFASVGWCD